MMKFIETLNASFVNFEEISRIGHEYSEKTDGYYSYIYLKNGEQFDFLDVPEWFYFEGIKYDFECDHLICWHRYAIDIICNSERNVIKLDDLMDESWISFIREFETLKKGNKNA